MMNSTAWVRPPALPYVQDTYKPLYGGVSRNPALECALDRKPNLFSASMRVHERVQVPLFTTRVLCTGIQQVRSTFQP